MSHLIVFSRVPPCE